MTLLDERPWAGCLFSDGEWIAAAGSREVREPATGAALGTIGMATPADLDTAVHAAVRAQRDWAAVPYDERAAVLRRAGDLPPPWRSRLRSCF